MKRTIFLSIVSMFIAVSSAAWAVDEATVQQLQEEVTTIEAVTEQHDQSITTVKSKVDNHDQKISNLEGGLPAEQTARIAADAALQAQLDNIQLTPGPAGVAGPQGPMGPAGSAGADGAVGPMGPAGPQGPAGADGVAGPQGLMGPAGADGAVGPMGPAGPQGLAGADGVAGPQGLTGPAGADGAVGPMGPAGPQGLAGADGVAGPQGLTGPAGADGAVGPMGFAGPAGADGLSAYQVWLNAGNMGTEADFLASLIGPEGPAGPAGPGGSGGSGGSGGQPGGTLAGAIQLRNADGTALDADDTVVVDTVNRRLGIGTSNPQQQVHTLTEGGLNIFQMDSFNASPLNRSLMFFRTATGTAANPGDVLPGNTIGEFVGAGWAGGAFRNVASIHYNIDAGTVSATSLPSFINFFATSNGSVARSEKMRLSGSGNLGIGTPVATQKLEVNGGIRINTSATKPACNNDARGTFWFTRGTPNDLVEVCANVNGILTWKPLW